MFLVLMAVFSFVFRSDPNYRLNLIIGLFFWDFFAEGTKVGLTSLAAKGFLLTKTRFPRWILVVTSISNPLITVLVFVIAIVTTSAALGRLPSAWGVGLVLLYLLQLGMIVIGFSLATSALFLRYRDLNQVWEVLLQAGFFVAPVVYPLEILPERLHFYLYCWPRPDPVCSLGAGAGRHSVGKGPRHARGGLARVAGGGRAPLQALLPALRGVPVAPARAQPSRWGAGRVELSM
jgi:hypothetical protein